MEGIRAPGAIAPGALPAAEGPPDPIDIIATLPAQGFAPHVELDENGRIVFAPPAALDAEGNNLPRLRNLLPELIATADALRDHLTRGNQAHAILISRLAAYRAQLQADLAGITLSRVLAEGIRLENAAAAARIQIAAAELPPHDEEAEEALESLLTFNRMFVMATADGPAMLADEARYRRSPDDEAALQSTLIQFAATASEDPAAIAPDVAETLAATVSQTGDAQEAIRARRLGESLAGNVLITGLYGATLFTLTFAMSAAGVIPASFVGWLGAKTIEKTKAFSTATEAGAKVLDKARELDAAATAEYLRSRLSHISHIMTRAKPSLTTLSRQDRRFRWLAKPLEWFDRTREAGAVDIAPPPGFTEAEVKRRLLANEVIPPDWRPHVRKLDFALPSEKRYKPGEAVRATIERAWAETTGELLRSAAPLAGFPNLSVLNLGANPIDDASPLRTLAALRDLRLDDTRITDLTPLSALPNLKSLNLSGLPEGIESALPRRADIEIIRRRQ